MLALDFRNVSSDEAMSILADCSVKLLLSAYCMHSSSVSLCDAAVLFSCAESGKMTANNKKTEKNLDFIYINLLYDLKFVK